MKSYICILLIALVASCSVAKVSDSWLNDSYIDYQPQKILIVGLTDNLNGRILFEEQMKKELTNRGVVAVESHKVFKPTFTRSKQDEAAIEEEIERLSTNGFDAVLISVVRGVDEEISYSGDNFRTYYYWRRFGRYYYMAQDVYLQKGYYTKYKVYHIEASLYDLKENNDKSLVWFAYYDLVDPKQLNKSVTNYVKAIINSLEEKQIILQN